MKTSNLIIILFIGSFFLVSAVGFTIGKYYPPEYIINALETKESMDLEQFSVVAAKGVYLNVSLGGENHLTYYYSGIYSEEENKSFSKPTVEVRNDTCFISRSGSSFSNPITFSLSAVSLKAIVLEEKTMMTIEKGNFDSLRIQSYNSNSEFLHSVSTEHLSIETIGKSFHNLGTVRHLNIFSDGARIDANGSNRVEGEIKNGSQIHLNKSKPKLDLEIDASSKMFLQ